MQEQDRVWETWPIVLLVLNDQTSAHYGYNKQRRRYYIYIIYAQANPEWKKIKNKLSGKQYIYTVNTEKNKNNKRGERNLCNRYLMPQKIKNIDCYCCYYYYYCWWYGGGAVVVIPFFGSYRTASVTSYFFFFFWSCLPYGYERVVKRQSMSLPIFSLSIVSVMFCRHTFFSSFGCHTHRAACARD